MSNRRATSGRTTLGTRLGVFGTGYAGLVTAVCFAELGHTVTAIDKDPDVVARLSDGTPTIHEPGLQELLTSNLEAGRLRFTNAADDVVSASDIVFLCVGTPPRSDGRADLCQVEEVARTIAPLLDGYKLIVEKSTVPARTARWVDWTIRRLSGPEREFDVASNPEFLREGTAVRDFLEPDRIVIGADTERARSMLLDLYERSFDCPIVATSVTTAELIKQTSNAFLATKISFINMVADLCEELSVDVATVARGVGLDPRIGGHFLKAGLGFGGSCLPKDLSALIGVAEDNGVDVGMLREVERINTARVDRLLAKVERALWVLRHKVVGVLGVSFKPETDDIRGAPSLGVLSRLHEAGAVLRVYDPAAAAKLAALHPPDDRLTYVASASEAAQDADALVILTDWDEFRSLDWGGVRSLMRNPIIVDGRNLFEPARMQAAGFEYYSLGRGDSSLHTVPERVRV
ncbi:MAG: UDP-glucose 6-dehydrogenase [Candidatus Rokuibacteriota bacterium]|nr:MAG: UDP-glucose 6-dehydrogenase [Candidatus Rokubacteria bacterium]